MKERYGKFQLEIDEAHLLTRRSIEDDQINRILKPILWPKAPQWLWLDLDYETRAYSIITPETKIKSVDIKDIIISSKELLERLDDQTWREKFLKHNY